MKTVKILIAALTLFAGSVQAQVISALPAASSVGATDIAPFSQGATTRKATALQIATYVFGETGTLTNKTITSPIITLPSNTSTEPRQFWNESDQAADEKIWDVDVASKIWCLRTRTDADAAGVNALCVTRGTGTALTNISLGNATNNPTGTWLGSGGFTFGGVVIATGRYGFGATTTTANGNGIYLSATNTVTVTTNSSARASFTTNGMALQSGGLTSTATTFTASGCSVGTLQGGSIAGRFTSGTTGVCTVTITLPTATNGWTCFASDLTTPAVFTQTAQATTSCTVSGTTTTGDVVTFMAIGY